MARTLVTGATGFTGRYVVEALLERGHEVIGLSHSSNQRPTGISKLYACDLTEHAQVDAIVSETEVDYVIHLAAVAFVAHDDVAEMYQANIIGTRNLLSALDKYSQPKACLVASSANIYGNSASGVISETCVPSPANDYAVSKIAVENLAGIYRDRFPVIVTRPFNYTGVGQSEKFIVPKIVDHALRKALSIQLGNIDVERDFSDVRTVARVYAKLIETSEAFGETFNISSGQAVSLSEVISMVEHLSGHRFDIEINPAFVRANEVKTLCGSRTKLESVIGPVNMPPLEETLRWMLGSAV